MCFKLGRIVVIYLVTWEHQSRLDLFDLKLDFGASGVSAVLCLISMLI